MFFSVSGVFASDDVFSCEATSDDGGACARACSQAQRPDINTEARRAKTSAEEFFRFLLTKEEQTTSSLGRPNVIFDPKMRYFTVVPMILYPPKVSSEHLVDDVGSGLNQRRSDPKPTYFPILRSYSTFGSNRTTTDDTDDTDYYRFQRLRRD